VILQRYPRKILDTSMLMSNGPKRTKDLLYESNDSRDIENGSISESLFPVPVEVPEGRDRFGQKPFFSGGDGLCKISRCFQCRL
jgi:hypothetical protein